MDEQAKKKQEAVSIFRYGLIAPALHMGRAERRKYFRSLAGKEFDVPHYGLKKYTRGTFEDWLYEYRKGGLDMLKPAIRSDKGHLRRISEPLIAKIGQIIKDYLTLSASGIHRQLIKHGHVQPGDFCTTTLRKCIRERGLRRGDKEKKARKKFEKENVNELWTCDLMEGPYLRQGKRKRKTYLLAIIDDTSRVIVGWGWFFEGTSRVLAKVLKQAIAVYGVCGLFYCDNGKIFRSNYLQLVAAKLGIALVHSQPYDSPSRGKIERFFLTVRTKFLAAIDTSKLSLSELNSLFAEWLDKDYHKEFHHGINTRPIDRYLDNAAKIKIRTLSSHELDNSFLNIIFRKVKNDATISVKNKLYEVPAKYIGKKVELSFPIDSEETLTLIDDGKPVTELKRVNLAENANKPYTGIRFRDIEKEADKND